MYFVWGQNQLPTEEKETEEGKKNKSRVYIGPIWANAQRKEEDTGNQNPPPKKEKKNVSFLVLLTCSFSPLPTFEFLKLELCPSLRVGNNNERRTKSKASIGKI